jgi:hypothetical protein
MDTVQSCNSLMSPLRVQMFHVLEERRAREPSKFPSGRARQPAKPPPGRAGLSEKSPPDG